MYGITEEKLHKIELKNTPKLFPVKFDKMSNILGIPIDAPFYVLTNTCQIYGATAICHL